MVVTEYTPGGNTTSMRDSDPRGQSLLDPGDSVEIILPNGTRVLYSQGGSSIDTGNYHYEGESGIKREDIPTEVLRQFDVSGVPLTTAQEALSTYDTRYRFFIENRS